MAAAIRNVSASGGNVDTEPKRSNEGSRKSEKEREKRGKEKSVPHVGGMEQATTPTGTPTSSDVADQLHEQLQAALAELVTSEDWKEALAVAQRFHQYSFSNTQLI